MSNSPQQFAQHDPLIDALAAVEEVAQVGDLLPVLEGSALIVAPELRARIQRRPLASVSVNPRDFQSQERRIRYCDMWNRNAIASSC